MLNLVKSIYVSLGQVRPG